MLNHLKSIVEDTDTVYGKTFAWVIQGLILLSLITFSVSTLPNLADQTKSLLWKIEAITVIIFTIEYISRVVVAGQKLKFIFSFYGIIDLLAILPFYLALGVDLRSVRAFRLLRMLRILKLIRYSKAMRRFHRAFIIAKEELILFFFVTVILLYLSAVGIYYFEGSAQPEQFKSVFHSLWWSVATLATVGYGDIFPITAGGRIFTFFVLMVGLGIVAVPTGLIASALSQARSEETEE
ncbi:MAG: ion transporter [Desulfocapsa sp.]|nr:ion transporter [Desulfocapsa sp.]